MVVHEGPRQAPGVAVAPEAGQAVAKPSCPGGGRGLAPQWGMGRTGWPLARRAVRGCGEVSVGRWLLYKLIVF